MTIMIRKTKHRGGTRHLAALMLVFVVSTVTVYARLDVNVALNRPTFASSVFNDPAFGGEFPPSRVVDGNKDPVALKVDNSCFHSVAEANPWLAVDLGAALSVVGVLFTNRGDGYGYGWGDRSNNFIIGLTDVSPAITAPTLWNYDLCARYPGVVGDGATVNLTCTSCVPPRRYLIVQVELAYDSMNFCEIEVYVRYFLWKESRGKRMMNKVASTLRVEHRVYCLSNCSRSPVCDSYNYRAADKTCQLNTHDTPLIANSADVVDDSAWGWWSTPFTQLF